jgi:YebC/PmpR family DNA-binding regulatory protein
MAGHSKWANIQHRKGAQDKKRGKLFTKFIREITIAARLGGGDASTNPRLRAVVDKAYTANMTKDVIERAIKRGAGGLEGADLMEIRYEGYAPGGVAVIVDTMTDNKNRTVAEVRHAFTKHGGTLGTDGSVAYLFNHIGSLIFSSQFKEDEIMEIGLEAGADDIHHNDDGSFEVITNPHAFEAVKQAFEARKIHPEYAEVTMSADLQVEVDLDDAQRILKMIDMLEDLDDVQNVYTNADIPEEAYAS